METTPTKTLYRDYLLKSLLDPQEADTYFEALCDPDVSTSDFLKSVQAFTDVYSTPSYPVQSFAALLYPNTQSWFWVTLHNRGLCRGGYYSAKEDKVIFTDCGRYNKGDWNAPIEQRKISFELDRDKKSFAAIPESLISDFENVLTGRYYSKYPFCGGY